MDKIIFRISLFIILIQTSACLMIHEPEDIIIPKSIYQKGTENSLWPGESSSNMLFVDNKARFKDDIVTILIEEQSLAEKEATTETKKESNLTLGISSLFGIQRVNPNILSSGAIGSENDSEFKGSGKTKRSGKFQAIITAKIIETLDNGNFLLQGKRMVKVNNETQLMSISGSVRPVDISFNNTVLSRFIADAKITYSGSGIINDKQSPGWAIRVFDLLWPF